MLSHHSYNLKRVAFCDDPCAPLTFRGNRSDRMKNAPKNVSKAGEDGGAGIGSYDNERLEGCGPPTVSRVDNGKLFSTCGDITSSNVGREKKQSCFYEQQF